MSCYNAMGYVNRESSCLLHKHTFVRVGIHRHTCAHTHMFKHAQALLSFAASRRSLPLSPVHFLILSLQLALGLPLFLFPCTVPCKFILARPPPLVTCPNHSKILFLSVVSSFLYCMHSGGYSHILKGTVLLSLFIFSVYFHYVFSTLWSPVFIFL